MSMPPFLYRALRQVEIDAGHNLIPKSQAPFIALPRLPKTLPITLDELPEHAVRGPPMECEVRERPVYRPLPTSVGRGFTQRTTESS